MYNLPSKSDAFNVKKRLKNRVFLLRRRHERIKKTVYNGDGDELVGRRHARTKKDPDSVQV